MPVSIMVTTVLSEPVDISQAPGALMPLAALMPQSDPNWGSLGVASTLIWKFGLQEVALPDARRSLQKVSAGSKSMTSSAAAERSALAFPLRTRSADEPKFCIARKGMLEMEACAARSAERAEESSTTY